jgi:hypothetical protein
MKFIRDMHPNIQWYSDSTLIEYFRLLQSSLAAHLSRTFDDTGKKPLSRRGTLGRAPAR